MSRLSSQHYEEIRSSGISDEIAERYFYSIDGQEAQDWLIEKKAAKLGSDSSQYATKPLRRLLDQSEHVKAGGWVCSANGQIKPDEPRQAVEKQADGQYLPVFNADGTPKLIKYEGRESPYKGSEISLMQPVGNAITLNGKRLIVVPEGGKKAAAVATLGYESIGLPGVDMGSFKEGLGNPELIPVLAELVAEGAVFAIAFDQDSKKEKRRGVAASLARLADLLTDAGCEVIVPVWSHKDGKGLDDVFVSKGADFVNDAISTAPSFKAWKASLPKTWFQAARPAGYSVELKRIEAMHAGYNARPVADITLNQRYLDKGDLPDAGSVVFLDSCMGSGKTTQASGTVEQQRREYPEAVIISSAYRNILLRQSGAALGITHWLDTDGEPSFEKFKALAACPESLPKLASQKIPDHSLFIIDEIVAWLRHVFTSDTMKGGADRIAVLSAIKTLFWKIIEGGGFVVCMEAGIPQWAVDCLKELLPKRTPTKFIRNEFKLKANQKAFFYDNLTVFKAAQEEMVKAGVRVIAASDSATQVDRQYRKLFNTEKDFHISAENSSESEAQRFAENPQAELMARGGLRFLSYSPTIGAGVSIDDAPGREHYFDIKTGLFTHLTSCAAAQQIARYRRFTSTHIYCQESGNGIGDGDLSIFDPVAIQARYGESAAYCHQLVNIAEYLCQGNDSSLKRTLERSLSGDLPDVALVDKWRAIITAVDNFDKLHLKENLKARLVADGYTIVDVETMKNPGQGAAYKEIREESEAESGAEFAAVEVPDIMTTDDAHTILSTHGHSRDEALQARKCLHQSEFPDCDFDNADFCTTWLIKNKGKKLSQLRAEWAARNPEKAKAIDRWHLKSKLKQAKNLGTGISAADLTQMSPTADIFAKAGLPEAIDIVGADAYDNSHPEVIRVAEWASNNKPLLKRIMRMQFDEDRSSLDIFNSLARKLGYQPQVDKKVSIAGKQEKQYILSDFCNPDRGHMLKSLSEKFAAKLEKKGESLDGKPAADNTDWGVSAEELEKRVAAMPKPEPVAVETPLYVSPPSAHHLDVYFEEDLVNAQTFDQLLEAKAKAPASTQRRVMELWALDGRRDALIAKKNRLKALQTQTEAID